MSQQTEQPISQSQAEEEYYEPWYKWGVLFLYVEMAIAIVVSMYALFMAFSGHTTGLGH